MEQFSMPYGTGLCLLIQQSLTFDHLILLPVSFSDSAELEEVKMKGNVGRWKEKGEEEKIYWDFFHAVFMIVVVINRELAFGLAKKRQEEKRALMYHRSVI